MAELDHSHTTTIETMKSSVSADEATTVRTEAGFADRLLEELYFSCEQLFENREQAVSRCPAPPVAYKQFNKPGLRMDVPRLPIGKLQTLTYQWFAEHGFDHPWISPPHESYKVNLTFDDVVRMLGPNRRVEAIDCETQTDLQTWDLGRLQRYRRLQPFQRTKVCFCSALESDVLLLVDYQCHQL
jgi:hypothetical protein